MFWRGDGGDREKQLGAGQRRQVRNVGNERADGRGGSRQAEFVERVGFPDALGITQLGNPDKDRSLLQSVVAWPGAEGMQDPWG